MLLRVFGFWGCACWERQLGSARAGCAVFSTTKAAEKNFAATVRGQLRQQQAIARRPTHPRSWLGLGRNWYHHGGRGQVSRPD
eukprot:COSAG06_NODE_1234_length_10140_cov_36.102579_4_plen_83_part_00